MSDALREGRLAPEAAKGQPDLLAADSPHVADSPYRSERLGEMLREVESAERQRRHQAEIERLGRLAEFD